MKKYKYVFFILLLIAALLVSCSSAEPTAVPEAPEAEAPAEAAAPAAAEPAAAEPAEAEPAEAEAPAAETVLNLTAILNAFTPAFNPFLENSALIPTVNGIFEPMMVYNILQAEMVPWLADSYTWSDDYMTLTFKLHEGVQWSDGEPFTASDVVFTFNLLGSTEGLGGPGLHVLGSIDSIEAPDDLTVVFNLNTVNTEAVYDIVKQNIVPEHIWANVEDPAAFQNENPVGTGPFTELTDFQSQVYQLNKNPYYWQEGKPSFDAIRVTAYSGNESQTAALIAGQIDWSGTVQPNIEQAVVANNPDISYVFPPAAQTVILNLNTTIPPFEDPVVRKAMSMAINREQIALVAFNGFAETPDVTGLTSALDFWKVDDPSALGDWTTYNPENAAQMLEDAGYTLGGDGIRTTPAGAPMSFKLTMVQGFTDWISAGEIMVQNWKDIGVNVETDMIDAGAYFGSVPMGAYEMALWFGWPSPNPYLQYLNTMSAQTLVPVGGFSMTNFAKVAIPEADELLAQFAGTADVNEKLEIGHQLQALFAEQAPVIPLWAGADWAIFNNATFTGWPTADNYYAFAFPNGSNTPENIIVMLTIEPVK